MILEPYQLEKYNTIMAGKKRLIENRGAMEFLENMAINDQEAIRNYMNIRR